MDYLLANLTQIGFTASDAKVYQVLLKESPAMGYQIAKNQGTALDGLRSIGALGDARPRWKW